MLNNCHSKPFNPCVLLLEIQYEKSTVDYILIFNDDNLLKYCWQIALYDTINLHLHC